jgi:hypothetical protein
VTFPFTFAWVDETQTTFNPSTMNVFDEDIFAFTIKHDEGQIPTLDLSIENPRVGLIAPGRKVWAWLAWNNNGTLVPLFFGVLVGVPTNLFKELVTLQFIARSPQFIANKQALAETMKIRPYYDPVWLDVGHRDDPDAILEGWSALWHIDRTTLAITHSDIINGEDGTLTFTEGDAFYDSVSLQLSQAPLTNIRVEATVNWTQRSSGYITVPTVAISSYTGESFFSGWPKAGAGIGGGYKVESSFVTDTYLVSQTPTTSYSSSWTNTDPNPGQCSNASAQSQSSGPALMSPNPLTGVLTVYQQTGICFPTADPPVNRPMTLSSSGIIVPLWNVTGDMTLRYDSRRQYSEILSFDMIANVQGILTSPTVTQATELMTLSSVDLSEPLVRVDAWTDYAGQHVGLAQMVFANNPTTPGGLAYQICVQAGTAGSVEPVFSDVPGFTTNDGSVIWASLGQASVTTASDWSPAAGVPLGQIMLLHNTVFNPASGEFEEIIGAVSYYLCTGAGRTNGAYVDFTYTPPVGSNLETTPAPRTISRIVPPNFSTSVGAQIGDGTVTWTVLGPTPPTLGIPIGGTIDNVTARSYFPTARGHISVEYLIARARARLRMRGRAVNVGFDCPFELAVAASCRKNASLADGRMPGGGVTGKIKSYTLSMNRGRMIGHIELGCAVGFGDTVAPSTGTPVYANSGYMKAGYQRYTGVSLVLASNDITYSPPAYKEFDDGLQFPLRWQDISDGGTFSGSLDEQKTAITASFEIARQLQFINNFGGGAVQSGLTSSTIGGTSPEAAWKMIQEQNALISQNTPFVMEAHARSWSMLLKPCAGNGPFGGSYAIQVSPLVLPQGINLEAPSEP